METIINQEFVDKITVNLSIYSLLWNTQLFFHVLLYIQSQNNTAECWIQDYLKEHLFEIQGLREKIFQLGISSNTQYWIFYTKNYKCSKLLLFDKSKLKIAKRGGGNEHKRHYPHD